MSGSTLSRRVSEFLGVVLFATAVFWLIALTTYNPADPVWFFNTGGQEPPANFAGRVGAFLAELSYQIVGFTAYLLPVVLVAVGWHYFWCRQVDAVYTKVIGLVLTTGCTAAFLSLAFGAFDPATRTFRAGGYLGGWLADLLAEYLNRTGSIIVILTLLFLALILTTQLSFSRLFSATGSTLTRTGAHAYQALRGWWMDRRREQERQGVLRKHLDRTGASSKRTEVLATAAPAGQKKRRRRARRADQVVPEPAIRATEPESVPLPLPEPVSKTPAERRQGGFTLPPLSLLDPPREQHKFDERELMDNARLLEDKCREFSSRVRGGSTGVACLVIGGGLKSPIVFQSCGDSFPTPRPHSRCHPSNNAGTCSRTSRSSSNAHAGAARSSCCSTTSSGPTRPACCCYSI